jgi:outer membrane protein TolC
MNFNKTLLSAAALALLAGCAVTPQPLTQGEVRQRVLDDQFRIYSDQEHVFEPIGFHEALARALKYNLDYRLKVMESAMNMSLTELSRYDMMPSVLASAGYSTRSNDNGSTSYNVITGRDIGGDPTSSEERSRRMAGAEFSWNVLDFGVGYYRAKQQADQLLISEERRKRVMQTIVQDVRSSYWRAVGAQRLTRQTEDLIKRVGVALEKSREAERMGLLPPRDALNYQRQLLDAMGLLSTRRQELEYAKRELAALMNVTPGTDFTVAEMDEPNLMPAPFNVAELEELALNNRPELREEDYRRRVSANAARQQMMAFLPNLSLNVGPQYDSNRYLFNSSWVDSSLRASFNLMRLASMPALNKTREAQQSLDDARRMALSMAVLTQVRVSVERYRMALQELDVARDSSGVDQRLLSFSRAAQQTRTESELELLRSEVRTLNSDYQRHLAYANAQAAFGRVYNSVGLEVLPGDFAHLSVKDLAKVIENQLKQTETDTFPTMTLQGERVQPGLRLTVAVPDVAGMANPQTAVKTVVEQALKRNQFRLGTVPANLADLTVKLDLGAVEGGVRKAKATISLVSSNQQTLGSTDYLTTLPSQISERAMVAFAEAAVVANLGKINGWLNQEVR